MSDKTLIVYDFDWSLADKDSDHHILEKFDPLGEVFIKQDGVWLDIMNDRLKTLYELGKTKKDFIESFKDFPISPFMIKAIQLAYDKGSDLYIISDGNSLFLSTIMEEYNITHLFKKVITNQAIETEKGSIILKPVESIHPNCQTKALDFGFTCSSNLCKGKQIDELSSKQIYKKTIYIGDGKNDFCAATHLKKGDLVLVRKDRTLENILKKDSYQIQADIQYWSNAEEVLDRFNIELI